MYHTTAPSMISGINVMMPVVAMNAPFDGSLPNPHTVHANASLERVEAASARIGTMANDFIRTPAYWRYTSVYKMGQTPTTKIQKIIIA